MNKHHKSELINQRKRENWLTLYGADFEAFTRQTSTQARPEDWPLAGSIEKNIPVYRGGDVRAAASDQNTKYEMAAEFNEVFRQGPGVLVIKDALEDLSVIDKASAIFEEIIADQHETKQGGADHFAKPGANDRIWNSLQKHAMVNPENFVLYYGNAALHMASLAWLGPGYQVTAQVNVVNPGGAAQSAHRDYHLGFMTTERALQYPAICHEISPFMTLQGGIAHCDMSIESGPTKLLPFSQNFLHGYATFPLPEYQAFFEEHHVQLEMAKGDMLFFNPALMHAAGENKSSDIRRMVNLFQVSSAFGRALESVDRASISKAIYPAAKKLLAEKAISQDDAHYAVLAAAEDYPFPTNLDTDPPVGGLVPKTHAAFMMEAIEANMEADAFSTEIDKMMAKRSA